MKTTDVDTSREAVEREARDLERYDSLNNRKRAAKKLRALLARAEKAEAKRDDAWDDAIEAAAQRIHQHIEKVQPEMTRRAQRLAEKKKPGFNYAIHRADLDARISCRDQVRALRKGDTP